MELKVRPLRRHVLLLDDLDETLNNGVVVRVGPRRSNLDYMVFRVGIEERCDFGQGDQVVLCDPDVGRKLKLNGVPLRIVRVSDVIGVIE